MPKIAVSVTEGGKMTREEANKKAHEIFVRVTKECREIEENAIKDGIWNPGLDGNRDLFREVDERALAELKALKAQIDE